MSLNSVRMLCVRVCNVLVRVFGCMRIYVCECSVHGKREFVQMKMGFRFDFNFVWVYETREWLSFLLFLGLLFLFHFPTGLFPFFRAHALAHSFTLSLAGFKQLHLTYFSFSASSFFHNLAHHSFYRNTKFINNISEYTFGYSHVCTLMCVCVCERARFTLLNHWYW